MFSLWKLFSHTTWVFWVSTKIGFYLLGLSYDYPKFFEKYRGAKKFSPTKIFVGNGNDLLRKFEQSKSFEFSACINFLTKQRLMFYFPFLEITQAAIGCRNLETWWKKVQFYDINFNTFKQDLHHLPSFPQPLK